MMCTCLNQEHIVISHKKCRNIFLSTEQKAPDQLKSMKWSLKKRVKVSFRCMDARQIGKRKLFSHYRDAGISAWMSLRFLKD